MALLFLLFFHPIRTSTWYLPAEHTHTHPQKHTSSSATMRFMTVLALAATAIALPVFVDNNAQDNSGLEARDDSAVEVRGGCGCGKKNSGETKKKDA
jgi:hypothetical protein